jgi:RNA polymerase sigma-70 factor (ECF subfamily)
MTTMITRLCLDRLKSAQKTREEYIGPWLPEPVLTSELENPEVMLERSESVTLAFLVLLEQLSPEERAVFLLKDVFEYDHAEIAEILGTTTDNSRQLLHRAKSRLARGRPRLTGTAQSRRAIAERFARAFSSGDASELTALLTTGVGMWSDGGGKATAARVPLIGRERVLNFLVGLHRTAENAGLLQDASLTIEDVNSEPALILRLAGHLESIFVLSIDEDAISGIRVVRNPDKLAHIERQLTTLH